MCGCGCTRNVMIFSSGLDDVTRRGEFRCDNIVHVVGFPVIGPVVVLVGGHKMKADGQPYG